MKHRPRKSQQKIETLSFNFSNSSQRNKDWPEVVSVFQWFPTSKATSCIFVTVGILATTVYSNVRWNIWMKRLELASASQNRSQISSQEDCLLWEDIRIDLKWSGMTKLELARISQAGPPFHLRSQGGCLLSEDASGVADVWTWRTSESHWMPFLFRSLSFTPMKGIGVGYSKLCLSYTPQQ